uniref:ATP synthase complex subunit 8 n=1 Tax=Haliotis tuberculata coccinea TaxID=37771 RepID=D3GA43_HALTU|nr:ATP synthase subunit 8 [Haliotis tuberculata coccinea]
MPQLAPINWLFLFTLFWITIATVAVIIWWSYKPNYTINTPPQSPANPQTTGSWPW